MYGYNPHRLALLSGFPAALHALRLAGCRRAYLNGSFVSTKETPDDFDACWDVVGVDENLLDMVLLDFSSRRAAQKAKYKGELFIADAITDLAGRRFLEFFQIDRDTEAAQGIIAIDLTSLP
jgi:hypothetical protein